MKIRFFLTLGAIAGPLFIFVVLLQDLFRPGFDPRIHLLSQLSLGSLGWIQVANFVGAGVLFLLGSFGFWKQVSALKGGKVASVFVFLFGAFLMIVGVFKTDPANGFPPGAVTPTSPTTHGIIHAGGALPTFVFLTLGILFFARLFLGTKEYKWFWYCLASAVITVFFFLFGMTHQGAMPLSLQLAVLFGWSAPSVVAMKFLKVLPSKS